jgi:Holliday junction resolvase RusA-like endonuclease
MTFVVFGQPATKGSTVSFMSRRGAMVTKADCRGLAAWTQAVGWAAREARVPLAPRGASVKVNAVFQFVRPKSDQKRAAPTVKPDVDKLGRALLDALTNVAYVDDAQVVQLQVWKVYGSEARTTVTVKHG